VRVIDALFLVRSLRLPPSTKSRWSAACKVHNYSLDVSESRGRPGGLKQRKDSTRQLCRLSDRHRHVVDCLPTSEGKVAPSAGVTGSSTQGAFSASQSVAGMPAADCGTSMPSAGCTAGCPRVSASTAASWPSAARCAAGRALCRTLAGCAAGCRLPCWPRRGRAAAASGAAGSVAGCCSGGCCSAGGPACCHPGCFGDRCSGAPGCKPSGCFFGRPRGFRRTAAVAKAADLCVLCVGYGACRLRSADQTAWLADWLDGCLSTSAQLGQPRPGALPPSAAAAACASRPSCWPHVAGCRNVVKPTRLVKPEICNSLPEKRPAHPDRRGVFLVDDFCVPTGVSVWADWHALHTHLRGGAVVRPNVKALRLCTCTSSRC